MVLYYRMSIPIILYILYIPKIVLMGQKYIPIIGIYIEWGYNWGYIQGGAPPVM